jgi:hypothetical protein
MDRKQVNKIRAIAKEARRWVERICELDRKSKDREFSRDCCGTCGIASAHLFTLLEKAGMKAEIAEGTWHAFVVCEDLLIDVTATQFRDTEHKYPPVVIKKLSDVKQTQYWWVIKREHENIRSFAYSQRNWPRKQRVSQWKRLLGKSPEEISA